ncbi:MAG: FAD-dependent oxidoreductase [Chthoniobacterales bacterium]|nr:FAD-dependent oxidoreductase [Chthoniobacterales bacterium]
MKHSFPIAGVLLFCATALLRADAPLYSTEFSKADRGKLPSGWNELGVPKASPKWGVDGQGFLRVLWKGENGVIAYEGLMADGRKAAELVDGTITAQFKKTPDDEVHAAVLGRLQNEKNFLGVRFLGDSRIELVRVKDGAEEVLTKWVTRSRMGEEDVWTLELTLNGPMVTGRVLNGKNVEQARVDAKLEGADAAGGGAPGLGATNFVGFRSFSVVAKAPVKAVMSPSGIEGKNAASAPRAVDYRVLAPAASPESLDTPFVKLASAYDVIVAGAGTGGWAASLQASRMGAKVLLLEESDWIGGQMAAAAVATMDEEGCWEKFPVRERGIYREFHESMVNFYYTMNKDPFRAYYAWPAQLEGGYEPKVVRAVLYAFIEEARKTGVLDLAVRSRVASVDKSGDTVTGVTVEHVTDSGEKVTRRIGSKVLVEATEYGDVLPLTGARYRVGTTTSDDVEAEALVQHHTWVGVIREYPDGVPPHLVMKQPPPGYDSKQYRGSQLHGPVVWGGAGKDVKGPRSYRVLFAWRGMADSDSPATGKLTEQRHTQCGLNGGRQDYPVTAACIEESKARQEGQLGGIYRTLSEIYYFQQELGLPWSVADDEGFDTAHNRRTMDALGVRDDLKPLAVQLPQWPYVREARRGRGLYTLRADDLTRFEKARLFPTAVAMGDYFMDLDHGDTAHAVEADLDSTEPPRGGGPFQVPFEVFIPEKIDGLVFAEKNISQSRQVNGATRLQPVTILTGQAAGAIAALAIRGNVQPRNVNPVAVQQVLLASGMNLVQRWYEDVAWGTDLWRASQLLSLYGVMDPPGHFAKGENTPLGAGNFWRPEGRLSSDEFNRALARLAELSGKNPKLSPVSGELTWSSITPLLNSLDAGWQSAETGVSVTPENSVTRRDFALIAAQILASTARPVLLNDNTVS